jgi:hypothetical protein
MRPAEEKTMAKREHRASAHETIADRDPDRNQVTADRAVAPMASVPWAPAEAVHLHQYAPVADASDNADDQNPETSADFDDASNRAPSRLRRAIPLLWAAALTVAALQHAGEVERRMALREPSSAEMDMQDRSKREIRAAWRSLGAVTVTEEAKQVEPVVVEQKAEPVMAKRQIEPLAARDEPLEIERPLVEPVTEVVARSTMISEEAEGPAKGTAAQSVQENINTAAALTKASEDQPKAEVARALPPPVSTDEPAKPRKGRVITSHAPQLKIAPVAKPKRARPARAQSIKYVELDGLSPRYFTIERPSRGSP